MQQLLGNNAPVEIVQGNGFLEVKPKKIKKKKLLKQFLREIHSEFVNPDTEYFEKLDYLMYIGADTSSEPLFEYLNRIMGVLRKNYEQKNKVNSRYFASKGVSYVCELGKKPSNAPYYIENMQSVKDLIKMIGLKQGQRNKNRSYTNLMAADNNIHGALSGSAQG